MPRPTRKASAASWTWWRDCARPGWTSLVTLDIGGGLGIRYRDERPLSPASLAAAMVPLVRDTGLTLVLEPGRYLVGSAGVLLTTVLSRKHSGGKDLVIVDAGMNDLVRPSHYLAYHEMAEVEPCGRPRAGGRGGPGLRDRRLPGPRPGAARARAGRAARRARRRRVRVRDGVQLQYPASARGGGGG